MLGKTILHYKILEKLGEGGMGEVYKAKDTKLARFVALKFLPFQLTASEDNKARFIQEAKVASAMNHPNVCTIYSIEEYNNQLFISMEYIEGKTLREKKDYITEKQIIEIGIQVAEGLAAAHEKGIVHRDIKPENIMIRKDGIAQIMDFGLAKLNKESNVSKLTKAGTTMGTMGYMSPEQVQGLDVDHRTDIFSLGVVLYELLAGKAPFKGMHETAIMYEIVNVGPPSLSTIKEGIDPQLDEIILECLEKDKEERFQSAKELARSLRKLKHGSAGNRTSRKYNVSGSNRAGVLRNTAANPSEPLVYEDVPLKKLFRNIVYNRKILWIIILTFFVSTILFFFLFLSNKYSGYLYKTNSFAYSIYPPAGNKFSFTSHGTEGVHFAVSPDGKMLAFVAYDSTGKHSLWVRHLDALTTQKLNGTDDAYYPFWSYDSKYIGFFAGGKLKKILASGGPSITICNAGDARGGSWNQNDIIVFEPEQATGLFKVPANGGEPKEVTKIDHAKLENTHRWPCFLPDGNHFIFYTRVYSEGAPQQGDAIYVSSLDGKEVKKLFSAHSNAVYVDNKILYVQDNILMAKPFDPGNLKLSGSAVPVKENVLFSQSTNCAVFSVSRNGVLLYQRGNANNRKQFALYDRSGNLESVFGKPDNYGGATLSSEGTKIVFVNDNSRGGQNIWLYDIRKKIYTRLTFASAYDYIPRWSPDGKWIWFSSDRKGNGSELYMKSSNGMGDVIQLTKTGKVNLPADWSSDNKYIGFVQVNPETSYDIYILPVSNTPDTDNMKPKVIFNTKLTEIGPWFSPDNNWILYESNESGQRQLYVSPFPNVTEGKWQVSTLATAEGPYFWTSDGKGIYYPSITSKLMYVEVNPRGNEFKIGKSTALFDIPYSGRAVFRGVTKDNKYFFFLIPVESNEAQPLTVVTNWNEKLKQTD